MGVQFRWLCVWGLDCLLPQIPAKLEREKQEVWSHRGGFIP